MAKRSTALAKRPKTRTRTVVKTRYRTRPAKAKRASRRPSLISGTIKKAVAAGAAGYLIGTPGVQAQVDKLPQLGNRTLTAGIGLYLANSLTLKNSWVKAGAEAAIIAGAFDFGARGFNIDEERADTIAIRGEDDSHAFDVSGMLGEDDYIEEDEEEDYEA